MTYFLLGGGGHAKTAIDILRLVSPEYDDADDIVVLDDFKQNTKDFYRNVPLQNGIVSNLYNDARCICTIGDNNIREDIVKKVNANHNVTWISLIHPSAVVSVAAVIGNGTLIAAGVVLQANCDIGDHCIVNTKAAVDHDCVIDNFTHVGPGSTVAGQVEIGERCFLGAGSVVIDHVSIYNDITIGAGAVVTTSLKKENTTYIGIPARPKTLSLDLFQLVWRFVRSFFPSC